MKKILSSLLFIVSINSFSQNDSETIQKLMAKDSSSIPFLCSYPDSFRIAAFTASTYPGGLIRLEEIQKAGSQAFYQAISKYNETRQKELWEIIRYPELPPLLIANKDKTNTELKILLKDYSEEITSDALYFTKKDLNILITIDNLNKQFERDFKETIKEFPKDVQKSYSLLVTRPELLSTLSEDLKTTVILGDIYKRSPEVVNRVADSLNLVIAKENKEEYEAWKKSIEGDTAVQKELKKLSDKYRKETVMYDDVYTSNNYEINIYYVRPYPYWAGHPIWYTRPYWYPYPWWYHSGYYYNPNGRLIIRGVPTYHFGMWYYGHRNYPRKYPKTDTYFKKHNYGPRNQNYDIKPGGRNKPVSPRGRKR